MTQKICKVLWGRTRCHFKYVPQCLPGCERASVWTLVWQVFAGIQSCNKDIQISSTPKVDFHRGMHLLSHEEEPSYHDFRKPYWDFRNMDLTEFLLNRCKATQLHMEINSSKYCFLKSCDSITGFFFFF